MNKMRSAKNKHGKSMTRSTPLLALSAALFFSATGQLRAQDAALTTNNVTNIHTTFGTDTTTQITVSWRTPFAGNTAQQELAADADVQYGTDATYGNTTAAFTFESAGGLQHHAELSNLLPATTYHYRVRSGETLGPDCTFRTGLPADTTDSFTFAVMGDVEGPADGNKHFPALADWLVEKDVAFFLVLGDLAYFGQQQSGWDGFFRAGNPLFQSCVFVPVIGDHSMERLLPAPADLEEKKKHHGTDIIAREAPTLFLEQFLVPDNHTKSTYYFGRRSLRGLWHSFDYGPAHILSIENTQELTPPLFKEAKTQQPPWVAQDLEQTDAPWRFVLGHRAFYPYESEETQWDHVNKRRIDYRTQWDQLFADGRVNLTMGAHIGGWIVSHPITHGKIADENTHGTVHMKLGKVGDYAKKPETWEVQQWGTALPENDQDKIPAAVVLITVHPDSVEVVTWD